MNYRAGAHPHCARCSVAMDPTTATYDKGGNLLCQNCAAGVLIAEGEQRAVSSLVSSAVAVPVLGLVSYTCVNQMFIVSIVAIVSGIAWLVMVARHAELRQRMGNKFAFCLVGVILGMLLGAGPIVLIGLITVI